MGKLYNIPHLRIKDVTEEAQSGEDEEAALLRERLEEIKKKQIEELEAFRKKKKIKEEINVDSVVPRFTEEMLCKAYKNKLSSRACVNRGYILDGYPKSYNDALSLFTGNWIFLIKY